MRRPVSIALLPLLACAIGPRTASAHLMPPGHATVHALGRSVYSVVSLPASTLRLADEDGDGLLSTAELERHQGELNRSLEARWSLRDGNERAELVRIDLIPQPADGTPPSLADRAEQVVMLHHARFRRPPRELDVETDLFGDAAATAALVVGVSRDTQSESATLRPGSSRHVFLATSWWRRGWAGAALGMGLLAAAAMVRRRARRSTGAHSNSIGMEASWTAI